MKIYQPRPPSNTGKNGGVRAGQRAICVQDSLFQHAFLYKQFRNLNRVQGGALAYVV